MKAHYAGDGVYAPSDSSPVTVTIAPEASKTLITIPVFDPITNKETGNTPASLVYGSPYIARVDVGNAAAAVTFPMKSVCAPTVCPTGSITLTDSINGGTATALGTNGIFPLNTEGYVDYFAIQLSGGSHQFSASYPGDNSFSPSVGTYVLTVMPAPTQVFLLGVPSSPLIVGAPVTMYATFNATNAFDGAGPTGTITFYDGAAQIPGGVSYSNGQPGSPSSPASLTGYITATFASIGTHQISAKYSGDANYASATAPAKSVPAIYATTPLATANPATLNYGQNVNVTVTMTGASKTPPMTGTFQFSGQFTGLTNPVTPTQGTDANGNQTLTATVTVTPQTSTTIYAYYPGDANYESNEAAVPVNVNIPDFSLNMPSSPLLISAGQAGSEVVTVAPASNLPSTVSLSCGGNAGGELPGGYSCAFSPATVNLSNGVSATSTFTLSPNAQTVAATAIPVAISTHGTFGTDHTAYFDGVFLVSGVFAVILLVWPVNWPHRKLRTGIFIFGVICLAVGCGSPSGGGGGMTAPSPQPTTITVSTSAAKVAFTAPVTFTATVSGSNNPTGSVLFYLNANFSGSANVIGNTAAISGSGTWIGAYVLTAKYTGDGANNPSTSTGVNLAVTGTSFIGIQGVTSTNNHSNEVAYTIQ